MHRTIFGPLETWAAAADHSVMLLRGARQVGKTYAVRHLSRLFGSYLEVNFEEEKEIRVFFDGSDLACIRHGNRLGASSLRKIQPLPAGLALKHGRLSEL